MDACCKLAMKHVSEKYCIPILLIFHTQNVKVRHRMNAQVIDQWNGTTAETQNWWASVPIEIIGKYI